MRFGKQSGIPLCCRVFFVALWSPSYHVDHMQCGVVYRWWSNMGWRRLYNYVPCPLCYMRGNKIQLVQCEYTR